MVEQERGCGFRKIGGVYLVSDGGSMACDGLPVELSPCSDCGYEIHQARSMQPIHAGYLASKMRGHKCKEDFAGCPLCYYAEEYADEFAMTPEERKAQEVQVPKVFFIMYVSKEFYTPESFIDEARTQGISKRIAPDSLPRGFKVGVDWVFLAHQEVHFRPNCGKTTVTFKDTTSAELEQPKPTIKRGIFYAFKPQRLELVLWKGTDAEMIRDYEERGYTVVLIDKTPENKLRHGDGRPPALATYEGGHKDAEE